LIEAIIATAILVGSTIVLAQLAGVGREHAWKADEFTRAQTLCQNKLNELLAGIQPLQSVENQTFLYDDQWTYAVQVEPVDVSGLSRITVTVTEVVSDADLARRTDQHARAFRLVRWTRQSAADLDQTTPSTAPEELPDDSPFPSQPLDSAGGILP
jgi:hypothetical protein